MSLERVFELQKRFIKTIGAKEGNLQDILTAAIGISEESIELLVEIHKDRNRPWDTSGDGSLEESVDILFYLTEYWILCGITIEDILVAYTHKYIKNLNRIIIKRIEEERPIKDIVNEVIQLQEEERLVVSKSSEANRSPQSPLAEKDDSSYFIDDSVIQEAPISSRDNRNIK